MSLSDFGENLAADFLFSNKTITRPTAWYVAIHTADPTETGAVAEMTTGTDADYVRKAITFADAVSGSCLSESALTWTPASGAAYTVTHVSLWDALTSGNCISSGALAVARAINNSTPLTIAIGDLVGAMA